MGRSAAAAAGARCKDGPCDSPLSGGGRTRAQSAGGGGHEPRRVPRILWKCSGEVVVSAGWWITLTHPRSGYKEVGAKSTSSSYDQQALQCFIDDKPPCDLYDQTLGFEGEGPKTKPLSDGESKLDPDASTKAAPARLAKRGPLAWGNAALVGPALPHALDPLAPNRLSIHAVDDATNRVYQKAVRSFLQAARRCDLRLASLDDIDRALAAYMSDLCFLQELGPAAGSSVLSGMAHVFQELRGQLPRSARCLRAWQQIAMVGEGTSACREVVALVAVDLLQLGQFEAAYLVLLSFDLFAREQDWVFLRAEDVAHDGHSTSLLFGRRERGERSKTGFMQGAIIGSPFLGAVIKHLAEQRGPTDQVFDLGQAAFRRLWWASLQRLGLERVGPPHRLRHTGAGEFVSRGGSLEQARRCGRWAAVAATLGAAGSTPI